MSHVQMLRVSAMSVVYMDRDKALEDMKHALEAPDQVRHYRAKDTRKQALGWLHAHLPEVGRHTVTRLTVIKARVS